MLNLDKPMTLVTKLFFCFFCAAYIVIMLHFCPYVFHAVLILSPPELPLDLYISNLSVLKNSVVKGRPIRRPSKRMAVRNGRSL